MLQESPATSIRAISFRRTVLEAPTLTELLLHENIKMSGTAEGTTDNIQNVRKIMVELSQQTLEND